jgi:hypothetical protein
VSKRSWLWRFQRSIVRLLQEKSVGVLMCRVRMISDINKRSADDGIDNGVRSAEKDWRSTGIPIHNFRNLKKTNINLSLSDSL